jgi:anaerobic selenocysteine-containing dehydrogenase
MNHPCDWVDEIDHAEPVLVHPETAEALGLNEGDWVAIRGAAGEIRTRVRLTEGIHPEVVAMTVATLDRGRAGPRQGEDVPGRLAEKGSRWWEEESYGGNARKVVPWPEDPHRESPGWMDTSVTLTRLDKKAKG